jgi:hypothetical protein
VTRTDNREDRRENKAGRRPLRRPERRRARVEDFEMMERTYKALALLESKWAVDIVLMASEMRRHARLVDNVPRWVAANRVA